MDITSHFARSARHTTHYLAAGPEDGPLLIFVHGWPELSRSWRHQLPVFGALGYRAIAADMRGYGQSSNYHRHEDYAQQEVVADMLELQDALGGRAAVWVGHDWVEQIIALAGCDLLWSPSKALKPFDSNARFISRTGRLLTTPPPAKRALRGPASWPRHRGSTRSRAHSRTGRRRR